MHHPQIPPALTQSLAIHVLCCNQSPVWSLKKNKKHLKKTKELEVWWISRFSLEQAHCLYFGLWHTGWGISRVGRWWIIHPVARRVERHPDSCRRSSTIKDKYGYVSHVYSAAPGRLLSKERWWNFATGSRRDRTGGPTRLLGVLKMKNRLSRNPIWAIKIMKNGNNSEGERELWSHHCFLLMHIIYPKLKTRCSEARENGSSDCQCHQRDHSSAKRARIQHQKDSFDFPPLPRRLCVCSSPHKYFISHLMRAFVCLPHKAQWAVSGSGSQLFSAPVPVRRRKVSSDASHFDAGLVLFSTDIDQEERWSKQSSLLRTFFSATILLHVLQAEHIASEQMRQP